MTGYSVLNVDTIRPIHRIITGNKVNDNLTGWTGLIVPYHFTVSVEIIDGDHKVAWTGMVDIQRQDDIDGNGRIPETVTEAFSSVPLSMMG